MTAHPFSAAGRRAALHAMAADPVDLLIIGGGITGCGLARDAALRGMRVALVERDDFACGTSSRSSKLVHGGLRYLATGDFGMTRESARERRVLRTIAPHLVHPLPFLLPVWRGQSLLKYQVGLWVFDRMAQPAEAERCRRLTPAELAERLPVAAADMRGGLVYGEYSTDDARFTLENALSSAQHGALVANHAPMSALLHDGTGRVTGAAIEDTLSGEGFKVRARLVVNATGPWAAHTLEQGGVTTPKQILPSKGIHILLHASRLPVTGAVALNSPGGRSGFAVRRGDYVYVGTTDEVYRGPLDAVTADRDAVAQVLALVQDCFPRQELTEADIIGTWAGLRPLIAQPGRAPRDTSRHDEVWRNGDGLLTVAGGKLTTYRVMAKRVMEHVAAELGALPGSAASTAQVPLPGAISEGEKAMLLRQLRERGASMATLERLTLLYGCQLASLLELGDEDPTWLTQLAPGVPALRGEVRLAVEAEMALTLCDVLDRRLALLLFGPDHGLTAVDATAGIMAALLGWSAAERKRQISVYSHCAERSKFAV